MVGDPYVVDTAVPVTDLTPAAANGLFVPSTKVIAPLVAELVTKNVS